MSQVFVLGISLLLLANWVALQRVVRVLREVGENNEALRTD